MTRMTTAAIALAAALLSLAANAQSPERPAEQILSFDLQGINGHMTPEAARDVLLNAGFAEKRGGDTWGKVPTASFTKGNITVAITHYEGRINALSEVIIFSGELLDYSDYLARIRAHFDIAGDDPACVERDYGTRCGFGDGAPKGARFLASLTAQMISIQLGRPQN